MSNPPRPSQLAVIAAGIFAFRCRRYRRTPSKLVVTSSPKALAMYTAICMNVARRRVSSSGSMRDWPSANSGSAASAKYSTHTPGVCPPLRCASRCDLYFSIQFHTRESCVCFFFFFFLLSATLPFGSRLHEPSVSFPSSAPRPAAESSPRPLESIFSSMCVQSQVSLCALHHTTAIRPRLTSQPHDFSHPDGYST